MPGYFILSTQRGEFFRRSESAEGESDIMYIGLKGISPVITYHHTIWSLL